MICRIGFLVLAATLAASCRREPPPAAPAPKEPGAGASATLIAETTSIVPGRPFTLGLDLDVPDGWHTYWENPGDAGMPPALQWRAPEGIRFARIRFPAPARFEEEGIVSLGYEGTVRLLADFETDAALFGDTARVEVDVAWMICRDICVPLASAASVSLDIAPDTGRPADAGFAHWRRRLPRPAEGWRVSAEARGDRLRLRVEPAAGAVPDAAWASARVFPKRRGALDLAALPVWQRDGAGRVADLTAGPAACTAGDRFEAVLAWDGPDGPEGWTVEAVVAASP